MNIFTKITSFAAAALISAVTLTGCTSTIAYTYNVSTGDKVEVSLDTSSGSYKLKNEDQSANVYDSSDNKLYRIEFDTIENSKNNISILDSSAEEKTTVSFNGSSETYYKIADGDACGYVVAQVPDSDTALFITSYQDDISEALGKVTVTKK